MITALPARLVRAAIIFVLFSFILALAYPVWAQDATRPATTRREVIKERISTREATLRAKLDTFRDKKKATAAARISDNLNKINAKQIEQMLKHLDKMTVILNRLEARVNQGRPDIKDQALARVAISDARQAIATATAAVRAQAAKDYTLQVSQEAMVRVDAKKMRDALHADLRSMRKLVIDAKQAVVNAIRVAKSGIVEIPKKEGTPSGQ